MRCEWRAAPEPNGVARGRFGAGFVSEPPSGEHSSSLDFVSYFEIVPRLVGEEVVALLGCRAVRALNH